MMINLRQRGVPICFGDTDSLHAYLNLVEMARLAQVAEYVVAPRVKLKVRGGFLEPGSEVDAECLIPEVDAAGRETAGAALMDRLVDRGFVLDKSDR